MRTTTEKSRPDETIGLESFGVRWTSVLDAMSEGISVHSTTGEILWANKQLCDIYGKSLSELHGTSYGEPFHGEMISGNTEERISGKVLSVHIEPLLDEQGRSCGFARIVRDVTEQHRAKEQLLKAERFSTLGQILSDVAHDVGTPLNVISGYTEFLLARTNPGEQGHKELSSILNQSKRIATLIGDALDMARAPQGRNDVIDLEPLLAGLLDLAASELRKLGVKATLTCRNSPALIYGEASQLRQALFNILLNAAQELGAGANLEIVIEELPDVQEFLTATVRGTGASGTESDLFSSVGRFLVDEDQTATPGLGLSLARQILRQAGASVGCVKGGGIAISLPAAPVRQTK
ncbi:MAG TPA: histidine kinase dimerization/phospho-acceptor domain-containing protein [Blastocatellia bacterium]|nr:histidine kinase dimerization/phospho-acceptor domain-containing protein [Blastocatellia bacterium]